MKKFLRKIANKWGYDFVKVNVSPSEKSSKFSNVKIGEFNIEIPSNNPLSKHYVYYPDYNIGLQRLSVIVSKKYPNQTLVDVGANVGDTIAVVKSRLNIPIIAIEGDDFSYSFLAKNCQKFSDIQLIKAYLGENNKEELISIEKVGWNNTLVPKKEGNLIKINTLDTILETTKFSTIKLIKIDTEGYDTIILRGAQQIIEKFHPILYFEYNRENMDVINEDGLSTIFSLTKYGYENIVFLDNHNRTLLHTKLSNKEIIQQLHNYADGKKGLIPHYDLCIFHSTDFELFEEFLNTNK